MLIIKKIVLTLSLHVAQAKMTQTNSNCGKGTRTRERTQESYNSKGVLDIWTEFGGYRR